MRITPDNIEELKEGEIFCFGSNENGRHGKGAAKQALRWGAKGGVAAGLSGQTYAIPTKSSPYKTLPLTVISMYINEFLYYAIAHPEYNFLVTKIGTGLAGYSVEDIAPMFKKALTVKNISLPKEFLDEIRRGARRREVL